MLSHYEMLLNRINKKEAKVCVVGMGYVGLPLVNTIFKSGIHNLIGLDKNASLIKQLNKGNSINNVIPKEDLKSMLSAGFKVTNDYSQLKDVDVLIICVPTPVNLYKEPDLSYVEGSLEEAKGFLKKGVFISLESTTWPGTTEEVIVESLEKFGFKINSDIFIGYSPEREDPGNKEFNTATIPKIVSGSGKLSKQIANVFYSQFIDNVVLVSNTKTAEMAKLLENIQRSVNIGLMNEIKIISDKMGIDIFEVISAASTKPFGFMEYKPGPGVGGHCIPVDPFYLTWKAKEYNVHSRFIELAGEINDSMPEYVTNKVVDYLNTKKKSLSGSKILILGISYKKDVADLRESQNLIIISKLKNLGAKVDYSDPYFQTIPKLRKYNFNMKSKKLTPKSINSYDLVLLLTDHEEFDYHLIEKNSKHIIDTRGKYSLSYKVSYA